MMRIVAHTCVDPGSAGANTRKPPKGYRSDGFSWNFCTMFVDKVLLLFMKNRFGTDFKSEATSKYILDHSGVFPTHFSYIKIVFSNKIGENQLKSEKKMPKSRSTSIGWRRYRLCWLRLRACSGWIGWWSGRSWLHCTKK